MGSLMYRFLDTRLSTNGIKYTKSNQSQAKRRERYRPKSRKKIQKIQSKTNAFRMSKPGSSPKRYIRESMIFCRGVLYDLQLDEGSHQGEEREWAQVVGGHVGGSVEGRAGRGAAA